MRVCGLAWEMMRIQRYEIYAHNQDGTKSFLGVSNTEQLLHHTLPRTERPKNPSSRWVYG